MLTFISKNFKLINQSIYISSVFNINLHSITCSKCGKIHCFHFHGSYPRKVKIGPVKINLKIYRIICTHCGITHAILPYSIIPYTQRTLDDTIIIYDLIDSETSFSHALISDHPSISLVDIFILKRSFHLWKDVMASISLDDDPCDICVSSFEIMKRNLSQMRFRLTDLLISL